MVCAMVNLFNRAAVCTAAGLMVLTACGGVGGNDDAGRGGGNDEVASLNSPSAGGGSGGAKASDDPDAGRPQIRLDSTNEEINRMYEAWQACLKEHGAAEKYKRKPNDPAVLACKGKEPLDPPELDPAKNPDYADDVREMVACMKGHGIKALVYDGNWALETGDEMNRPHYNEYELQCQVKAFGEDK